MEGKILIHVTDSKVTLDVEGENTMLIAGLASVLLSEEGGQFRDLLISAFELADSEVEKIKIGDKCLDENGNEIEVVSIVEEHSSTQTYTLFVKDNQNFYANGVLVYDEEK